MLNEVKHPEEILRGLRHNYVAKALRMTCYVLFLYCYKLRI
jgi:hypothetical protein